jgi:prevent-host-death family protein
MTKWQLQEAKARLSEVVRMTGMDGPQMITHRGKDAAVVLSADEYRRLTEKKKNFVEFLLHSEPKWDDDFVELVNQRSKNTGRKIDL